MSIREAQVFLCASIRLRASIRLQIYGHQTLMHQVDAH